MASRGAFWKVLGQEGVCCSQTQSSQIPLLCMSHKLLITSNGMSFVCLLEGSKRRQLSPLSAPWLFELKQCGYQQTHLQSIKRHRCLCAHTGGSADMARPDKQTTEVTDVFPRGPFVCVCVCARACVRIQHACHCADWGIIRWALGGWPGWTGVKSLCVLIRMMVALICPNELPSNQQPDTLIDPVAANVSLSAGGIFHTFTIPRDWTPPKDCKKIPEPGKKTI